MDFGYDDDSKAFADSARALFADYCSDDALRAYVARVADEPARSYLTQQRPELDFLDYDWTLNAQPGQRPE
mgnify:CR=1 FL=1